MLTASVSRNPGGGGVAGRFVRNTAFSLMGRGWLLVLSLVSTPFIVKGLGDQEYGLYTIAGILGAYLAFLDIGVQNSTQKYVAEFAARGSRAEMAQAVWGSALVLAVAGLVGGGVIFLASPWLARSVFKASVTSLDTMMFVLHCASASFALGMLESLPTAILKGLQRFGWEASVAIGTQTLRVALVLAVLLGGGHIRQVMLVLLAVQVVDFLIGVAAVRRLAPDVLEWVRPGPMLKRLISYGSWVSVTRWTGPILSHAEKVMITNVVSVGALTYYAVPFNVLAATSFAPLALINAAFSTLSELDALGRREQIRILYLRVEKVLLLYILPIVLVCLSLAPDLLTVWIGEDFAVKGAASLRILSVAMVFHVLGMGSFVMLLGLGRPDLLAKISLGVVAVYLPAAYMLIRAMGIEGAAWAWLGKAVLEFSALTFLASRCAGVPASGVLRSCFTRGSVSAVALGAALGATQWRQGPTSIWIDGACLAAFLVLYAVAGWRWMLDAEEKDLMRSWWRGRPERGEAK